MNKRLALISIAALVITLSMSACSIRKELDTAADRMQKDHKACQEEIEKRLVEYGKRLEELYALAEKSAGKARDEIYGTIDDIRRKQKEVVKKYDELKSASGKTWKNMQRRLEHSLEDLEDTYDKALALFQ